MSVRGAVIFLLLVLTIPAFAVTRFVATDGSDSGDCLSAPCRSVSRAIQRADSGDVIEVGAGRLFVKNARALAIGTNAAVHANRFGGNDVDIQAIGEWRVFARLDDEEVMATIFTSTPRRRAAGH